MKTNKLEIEHLSKKFSKISKNIINIDKYIAFSLTHHSTAIEGSTLTETQVHNLLEFGKTSNKPFFHHLMVADCYNAFNFMESVAKQKKEINLHFIQQLGGLVVHSTGAIINTPIGTFNTAKGNFRLCSVRVSDRYFPDYKKVPILVNNLIAEINSDLKKAKSFTDKMETAFKFHFIFVSTHPFGDGNGRTSRLLMNYVQKYFNLPYTFIYKEDKLKYYTALETARKKEDITIFYDFMYNQHVKFIKKELKTIESFK